MVWYGMVCCCMVWYGMVWYVIRKVSVPRPGRSRYRDRDWSFVLLKTINFDDIIIETKTKTFNLGLMISRPRPILLNEVSRDRDFFETRHFRSHRYRDRYRDQESLGTEGLGTETAHL